MLTACETLLIPLVFKTASPSGQHDVKQQKSVLEEIFFAREWMLQEADIKILYQGKGKSFIKKPLT